MPNRLQFIKRTWFILLVGLLLGAGIILAIRYATYAPKQVHYHANFAVFINGERETFKGSQYYQEVAVCSSTDDIMLPQQRGHLHDEDNAAIHVHDSVVTWGQFFENLGWYIGPDFIQKDDGTRFAASGENKLHILLNGQNYTDLTPVTNMVIKDKDQLLVSFGEADEATLEKQAAAIPETAARYNQTPDPASCAGSSKVTPSQRLKHLF